MKHQKWILESISFQIRRRQILRNLPVVNIDKAFESPHTHNNSFARAACLIAPMSIISYPRVLFQSLGLERPRLLENGNMDRDQASLFKLSHLPCVNFGLPPVPVKWGKLCASPTLFKSPFTPNYYLSVHIYMFIIHAIVSPARLKAFLGIVLED